MDSGRPPRTPLSLVWFVSSAARNRPPRRHDAGFGRLGWPQARRNTAPAADATAVALQHTRLPSVDPEPRRVPSQHHPQSPEMARMRRSSMSDLTSASLIGRWGSSAFRLSTTTVSMSLTGSCFSSESAPGVLPSWDSRTRRNNLSGGLAVRRTVGPSRHANSPHPSSREGHHSTARWSSSVLLLD